MSARQIIAAITRLSPQERVEVVRFAQQYEDEIVQRLTPEELGELADRLVAASSETEAEAIKRAMINGFYGAKIDA